MIRQLPEVRSAAQLRRERVKCKQDNVLMISENWLSHIKSDFIIFKVKAREKDILNSRGPLFIVNVN